MSKKAFEEQLAALDELRRAPPSDNVTAGLRKALKHRSNYVAAKAARIAGELSLDMLIPDLLTALDRFFIDTLKSDAQCWAKIAIVKALGDLGHAEAAAYLRGLHYRQMEAVWGGREDTAGPLRCQCALGLIQCRQLTDVEILAQLIELLVDPDKTVRAEAARAIGRMDRPEAAVLLRLRALLGDKEPEVMGAFFLALLSIEGEKAFDFLSRFFDRGGEVGGEAALAVGMLRSLEAFQFLKKRWAANRDPDVSGTLLAAIALVRDPQAVEFLVELLESDSPGAAPAITALASTPISVELRSRIEAAVERSGNPRLRSTFEKHFR